MNFTNNNDNNNNDNIIIPSNNKINKIIIDKIISQKFKYKNKNKNKNKKGKNNIESLPSASEFISNNNNKIPYNQINKIPQKNISTSKNSNNNSILSISTTDNYHQDYQENDTKEENKIPQNKISEIQQKKIPEIQQKKIQQKKNLTKKFLLFFLFFQKISQKFFLLKLLKKIQIAFPKLMN